MGEQPYHMAAKFYAESYAAWSHLWQGADHGLEEYSWESPHHNTRPSTKAKDCSLDMALRIPAKMSM